MTGSSAALRRYPWRGASGRPCGVRRSGQHGDRRPGPGFAAVLLLAVVFLLAARGPALAEFTVCNQTLDVVNLAVGAEVDREFQTDGWWTIGADQCVNVIRRELADRYIYIYATDVFGHAILNGSTEMCVDSRRFTIRGISDCWQRGHVAARFYEVDTRDQVRWTFFLTDQGP